ncbi:MAG: hypothetical protein HY535_04950 [Chloroflexi bacterium]|nr:hypothetical protein [Chloroflexota bacterium]
MTTRPPRKLTAQEVQLLARVGGIEIPPDRLERLAAQVSGMFQLLDQLDPKELQDVEPATVFSLPLEPGAPEKRPQSRAKTRSPRAAR